MAIVDVHFYKPSGKFYTDAEIDIGETSPWDVEEIKRMIIKSERGVTDPRGFHAVIRSKPQGDFIDILVPVGTW